MPAIIVRRAVAKTAVSRLTWLAPALSALLCLLPLILLWSRFRNLYWFHDDWDLLSEMQSLRFTDWLGQRYGENFAPVFNAFWEGAILLVHGSYMGMILVLWGTHWAILLLFAAVLRRCGFAWQSASLGALTLGMPWSNIESLGWAACWVSLLTTFFFLLAWLVLLEAESQRGSPALSLLALLCAMASALSFSRGILTGALLAFFISVAPVAVPGMRLSAWRRWMAALLFAVTLACLFPYRWMPTNYPNLQGINGETAGAMASYGAHYALLSPLFHLLPIPHKTVGLRDLLIVGTCKAMVVAFGLLLTQGRMRRLLWTLLLLDLAMGGLLAIGRYRFDMETAVSYRYQYLSLLCFAPFLATVIMKGLRCLQEGVARHAAFAVIFTLWGLLLGYPWARHSQRWSRWRGTEVRNALAAAPPDQRFGLPSITAARAKELIAIYNLH